jgi:hypothetical protein
MSAEIINQLQELQENSNKKLSQIVVGYIQDHNLPRALVEPVMIANGKWAVKPVRGASSLLQTQKRESTRRVTVFNSGNEYIAGQLNTALLGGESYPILTTALSIAGGFASTLGGILFSVATTGLSLANTSRRVLARPGDEIWHVESIGKVNNKAIYVSSFILTDPFRRQSPCKGWLIHEEREEVILS